MSSSTGIMVYPAKVGEGGEGSESIRPANPFLNLTAREWDPILATRRDNLDYASENMPLIEGLDLDLKDGSIECFMKSSNESDTCFARVEKVREYCFSASLEALTAGKGNIGGPVAWLDERSSAGNMERVRAYRGPLTARQLYQKLKRPVSLSAF
jgi:hypothetical protein